MNNDNERLKKGLEEIRKAESLDILTLNNQNGQVIVRSRNPSVSGDSQAQDKLVSKVLSDLFIIKEIIAKHGADIWVEPRENGNSFVFQIQKVF